jgi:uncharacterized repeat protein (TIGR03803 family)
MAEEGGTDGYGSIFSFNPVTNIYNDLFNFNDSINGKYPFGSLFQAANGKLYGMTTQGGLFGYGIIFKFDISTSTFTKIHDFDSISGSYSSSTFIQALNGKLYAITGGGGVNNLGVIFTLDINSNTYTYIYNFDTIHGSNSSSSLIQDSLNGLFYGMTKSGGIYNYGVIFNIDTNNNYNVLYNFNDTLGKYPCGNLIIDPLNGNLYGLAVGGGANEDGVLFSFNINTNIYSDLIDFNGSGNGINPVGSLFLASNGLLYGTAEKGGIYNDGTIFHFNISDTICTKLIDMNNADGILPVANFIEVPTNVGIPNINIMELDISIYPNPFNKMTTLSIKGNASKKDYTLSIYNILGQEVRSIYAGNNKEKIISRENLPSGMYFYRLIDNTGQSVSGKLMIED